MPTLDLSGIIKAGTRAYKSLWDQLLATPPQSTPYGAFNANGGQHLTPEQMVKLRNAAITGTVGAGLVGPVAAAADAGLMAMPELAGNLGQLVQMAAGSRRAPKPQDLVTAERVLGMAGGEGKGIGYGRWRAENPKGEEGLFDYANAQPAIPGRTSDVPRYEPKKGTSDRVAQATKSRRVQRMLKEYAGKGAEKMPESWYRTGPFYEVFERVYGPEGARQEYVNFIRHIAATSPGMKVPDNIRTGSYYWHLFKQGQPVPEKPAPGYGAKTQNLHMDNAREIRAEGMDPLKRPKAYTFTENLLGNERPVTIDTHDFRVLGMLSQDPRFLVTRKEMERALPDGSTERYYINPREMHANGEITMKQALEDPTYWESAPAANEYAHYERAQQKLAAEVGMTPSEWQEKLWVGAGDLTGLGSPPEPWLRTLGARVKYTADQLGVNPDIVLEKLVKGEIPLLQLMGGAVGLGALTQQDEDNPGTRRR